MPAILKHFRQSVLAAACSGRLTSDWRESHISKISAEQLSRTIVQTRGDAKVNVMRRSEPLQADCSQLSDVPEEWAVTSLDQLSCLITSGSADGPSTIQIPDPCSSGHKISIPTVYASMGSPTLNRRRIRKAAGLEFRLLIFW